MFRSTKGKPKNGVRVGGLALFFCLFCLFPAYPAPSPSPTSSPSPSPTPSPSPSPRPSPSPSPTPSPSPSSSPVPAQNTTYSSPDEKVKLQVPAGAITDENSRRLIAQNPIQIDAREPRELTSFAPANTSILAAADFIPSGVKFSKPASVFFTLPQAEIPGTRLSLAFYDSTQGKFIPTGTSAEVGTDGYVAGFKIMHFSSYAVLKSLTPISAPIGAGVKVPLPDLLTGAFSYGLPIAVPPGRKGMQPGLALSYRSANPNSWVGAGFSLSPGYIVRSTRLGLPTYVDEQDAFYFITDSGASELVHLTGNLYQAKIESGFTKFFKESDNSWRIQGKDGSLLYFGQSPEAREGADPLHTFSWYLTRAQDLNGNYIEYTYTQDKGKSYLHFINYTGNTNGILPTNTIEFFTDPRDDISSSYISGAKIATALRLWKIEAKVKSDLAWSYLLAYDYSPDTHRSLLKSVTRLTKDNQAYPAQTFTYQSSKE